MLEDGLAEYRGGMLREACAKFEEAFQKKPSSDVMYAFVRRNPEVLAAMTNGGDETIERCRYRIFELSKPGR